MGWVDRNRIQDSNAIRTQGMRKRVSFFNRVINIVNSQPFTTSAHFQKNERIFFCLFILTIWDLDLDLTNVNEDFIYFKFKSIDRFVESIFFLMQ